MIYKFSNSFPPNEQFGLINQVRRAGVSITSNISEGFVRKSKKEKIQFYYMSLGSLTEVRNQIQIAYDIHYLSLSSFKIIGDQAITVGELINSLIKTTNKKVDT